MSSVLMDYITYNLCRRMPCEKKTIFRLEPCNTLYKVFIKNSITLKSLCTFTSFILARITLSS